MGDKIETIEAEIVEEPPKKKRGRKKGSTGRGYTVSEEVRNKNAMAAVGGAIIEFPEVTEIPTKFGPAVVKSVGKIGDDKVGAFVNYHMEMFQMRQGVNKKDVNDLYRRFGVYLDYCASHNIMPNNMNAYFAIGISRQDIDLWARGLLGTPEHKQFATDVKGFFESIHEQAPTEGLMNPISAMFWQKTHDGFVEASKIEASREDPLGEMRSTEEIADRYKDIELPD